MPTYIFPTIINRFVLNSTLKLTTYCWTYQDELVVGALNPSFKGNMDFRKIILKCTEHLC